ncbi:MAG: hypothetical protein WCJ18_05990 [Planctomycetota bacterium]
MNAGYVVGLVMALALPLAVRAANFEDGLIVTDQSVLENDAADTGPAITIDPSTESILVEPPALPHAKHGEYHAGDEQGVFDGSSAGCSSCTDAGCVADAHHSLSPTGTINRILMPVTPRWTAQIDALMLWQGNIPSRVLYTETATGLPALDANQAQPPMSAGPRYGLFLNLDPVYSIEGNYFNVRSFAGQAATPVGTYNENNLAGFGQFGPVDAAEVITNANIQSAELNWRRRTCGPITWLGGFRWVEWNQEMLVGETSAGGPYVFDTRTGNDLYGGQVGMDLCLWNNKTGPIKVNGIGKAGIFYNTAHQRMAGIDFSSDPATTTLASAVADQTAFVGEVGANASLRLTNWLSWRAGYTLFWLSGVATPAGQFSTTDLAVDPTKTTINTNGSVLLHGVTTGLEARW